MAGIKHKDWRKLDKWEWPYLRFSDGPEYECPHGIGHSFGVHGCDGCCTVEGLQWRESQIRTKTTCYVDGCYEKHAVDTTYCEYHLPEQGYIFRKWAVKQILKLLSGDK